MNYNYALFVDTVSIQQYIFSSNKLRENIGASYIVETLLFETAKDLLAELNNRGVASELGYIGGGNALLFFEDQIGANNFKQQYSRKVLAAFPGIRIAFAEEPNFCKTGDGFVKSKNRLVKSLIKNKSLERLEIMPYKHGIVDDCSLSNEGQEVYDKDLKKFISHQSALKLKAAELSKNSIDTKYRDLLSTEFTFTNELDKLGQPDEKGYIAIIHADGNGIGEWLGKSTSLQELQIRSNSVKAIAEGVLVELIGHLVTILMKSIPKNEGFVFKKDEDGKTILPFRQILAGGDDITFVCEGKLGVYLAKKLLELMSDPPEQKWMKVNACAGVAIVHTKFPFYKAYQLAAELCDRAKLDSRMQTGGNANRLAFLVSASGASGNLETIIEQNYSTDSGDMFYGSYSFGEQKPLANLINGIAFLQDPGKISKNKVLAIRDILNADKAEQEYFLKELESAGMQLPNELKELWIKDETSKKCVTPLYDMIDLMEFYPAFLQTI